MYDRAPAVGGQEGDASRARDTLCRRTARVPTATATAEVNAIVLTARVVLPKSGVPAHAVGWISRHWEAPVGQLLAGFDVLRGLGPIGVRFRRWLKANWRETP
jgi:hypothetical protein